MTDSNETVAFTCQKISNVKGCEFCCVYEHRKISWKISWNFEVFGVNGLHKDFFLFQGSSSMNFSVDQSLLATNATSGHDLGLCVGSLWVFMLLGLNELLRPQGSKWVIIVNFVTRSWELNVECWSKCCGTLWCWQTDFCSISRRLYKRLSEKDQIGCWSETWDEPTLLTGLLQ